jgi:hypothetical protein
MRLCTVNYISVNRSTCFGWQLHPSSGGHITVITTSGTGETSHIAFSEVWPVPDAGITVICAPDDGWSYHPKHVEHFTEI